MVCPLLHKGNCEALEKKCKQKYVIKMIAYGKCKIFSKNKGKVKTILKKRKDAKKKHKALAVKHAKLAKKAKKARKKVKIKHKKIKHKAKKKKR